eukprot:scaffold107436_cov45-Prasinocladus_malaysianus.AAC.2
MASAEASVAKQADGSSAPRSGGSVDSIGDFARFGVVTVSDRASAGVYDDVSGPAILNFFAEAIQSKWAAEYVVVPDEKEKIEVPNTYLRPLFPLIDSSVLSLAAIDTEFLRYNTEAIIRLVDERGCSLVVTTGRRIPTMHTCLTGHDE